MWDMSDPLGKKDDEKIHMGCLAPGTYLHSSDLVLGGGVDDFLVPNIRGVFVGCTHILEFSQKFIHDHNFLSVAETL
jgi:hypothetical protein